MEVNVDTKYLSKCCCAAAVACIGSSCSEIQARNDYHTVQGATFDGEAGPSLIVRDDKCPVLVAWLARVACLGRMGTCKLVGAFTRELRH